MEIEIETPVAFPVQIIYPIKGWLRIKNNRIFLPTTASEVESFPSLDFLSIKNKIVVKTPRLSCPIRDKKSVNKQIYLFVFLFFLVKKISI